MDLRIQSLTIDCANPARLGAFWSAALGLPLETDSDDEAWIGPGEGHPHDGIMPDLLFLKVPATDAKVVKNRLHLDLRPVDQAAEVARLEALGARRADVGQVDVSWVVMADPEGNEFCVLQARPAAAT
ncbi:MAG TPA: VOC family protein [Trebonia sp.]|jgi:hypothetical protein|nr:VOC family protein [Trebonia sp.]